MISHVCPLQAPCCCCALAWKQESKLLRCVKVVLVRVLCVLVGHHRNALCLVGWLARPSVGGVCV